MDNSSIRIAAQIALTTWAVTLIAIFVFSRKRLLMDRGGNLAVLGLVFFSAWMFSLSISSASAGPIERSDLLWPLAFFEMGTAVCAWGWLVVNLWVKFRLVSGDKVKVSAKMAHPYLKDFGRKVARRFR